jgi:hypothetical protein
MCITHDTLGHKAFYVTKAHIDQHFWWLSMVSDIHWYTKTCHICQLHQTHQMLTPPAINNPAPIFTKVCINTMPSGSYCQGTPAAYPPVTGQGRLNGCGSAKAG